MSSSLPQTLSSCRTLLGEGSPVQPKAPLLQILRVAGANEVVFTLKEVMHYLGRYIMGRQLFDKQTQHMVHCQDDPLGKLLGVETFSVKNPSPVYEMLKKHLVVVGSSNAAETLSLGRECVESGVEDRGQVGGVGAAACQEPPATEGPLLPPTPSQRRPRECDGDSLDGLPRPACKRPRLDVTQDQWDLSGLPWWFLGNLSSPHSTRSNGSTDILTNQVSLAQEEEDATAASDTTGEDLLFLAEGEQVGPEMKEVAPVAGDRPEEENNEGKGAVKEETADDMEEPDEDSQCLSDDTDTEISTQDAWQCTECRKFNVPLQRYCIRCWALRKNWYQDVPLLAHSLSVPDIPACSSFTSPDEEEDDSDAGVDVPDCGRTVSDPVILPSHCRPDRPLPTLGSALGRGPLAFGLSKEEVALSGGESQESLGPEAEAEVRPEALLEPCRLCRGRPRNGNIIHGRTAHLVTCFPCAKRLHKAHAPCPGCGKIIQRVIKIFVM